LSALLPGGTLYTFVDTFGHGFVDTSITELVTESLRFWRSSYGFGYKEHGHYEASQKSFMLPSECRDLILPIHIHSIDVLITAFVPSNIASLFFILLFRFALSNKC
jgi:hypothetical protein